MSKVIKIIILLFIFSSLAMGYYLFSQNQSANEKLSKIMKTASEEYFKKYISYNESTSVYEVTLAMLKTANQNGENYNLKGLEQCDKEKTLAKISINFKNGEPKDTEIKLSC